MAGNEDLIKKYGGNKTATEEVITSPNADLINKFSGGTVQAQAPQQQANGSIIPRPMSDAEIAESNRIANSQSTPISQYPFVRHGIKGFKEATDLAGSGYSDIAQNKPASGVGKIALGHTLQALNSVVPILPIIEAGTEQVAKLSGNPDFAKRAELVATSGLPIARTAKAVQAAMPSSRAVNTIVEAIGKDKIPEVIEKLKSNPRLTLMDVDPNVQIINQGLAARPGEPRNILDKVVKTRNDTKLDAVTGAIDEAMGVPPNMLKKVESLNAEIKKTGKEINPIIENTGPVDISNVIASIDAKLKPGVNSVITMGEPLPLGDIEKSLEGVKKLLTDGKSVRTDAKSLHAFQSSLRAKAEDLLGSSSGQDRQLGRALMDVRNQVVSAIDNASPQSNTAYQFLQGKGFQNLDKFNPEALRKAGATDDMVKQADEAIKNMATQAGWEGSKGSYRPALSKYRDVNDIQDAFKKGQLITKNKLGHLDDDPSYWEKWIKEANPQELEAAKEGARLAVAHQMGAVTNAARKGIDVPTIQFNREKLELLFGKEEVTKMYKALNDERTLADTNSKLMQGSMTAMRLLGAKATEVRPDYEPRLTKTLLPVALEAGSTYLSGGSIPMLGAALGLSYPYVRGKITKVGQKLDEKTNVEIANLSSAVGEARENIIKALQEHIPQGKLTMKQKLQLLPIAPP